MTNHEYSETRDVGEYCNWKNNLPLVAEDAFVEFVAWREYREMYAEYCIEGNTQPTEDGFVEFIAWRKRVEDFFKQETENE